MSKLTVETVKNAVEKGGSIRGAAKMLGISYTSVQWFLAREGYELVKKATIQKRSIK